MLSVSGLSHIQFKELEARGRSSFMTVGRRISDILSSHFTYNHLSVFMGKKKGGTQGHP